MKLTTRQQKVVDAKDKNILCLAGAGSFKTGTLTERFRHLIVNEKVPAKRIAAVTYTNMAAEEMRERLGPIANESFIGTIHSLANLICTENFLDTTQFIVREEYDRIIDLAMTIPVKKYPKFDYLFVDEAQDLSQKSFLFLERYPITNRFFCGDDRQMIYGFNGGSDRFIEEMAKDDEYTKYYLTEDFRNPPNIIKYAEKMLGKYTPLSPHNVAVKKKDGAIEECTFSEALEILKIMGDWGQWFILTRSNKQLEDIGELLTENEVPFVTFKQGELAGNSELKDLLKQNKVKLLTVHASKGLSAPNVIAVGCKFFSLDERRIAYVAATRAEQNLYWCPSFKTKKKRESSQPATKKTTTKKNKGIMMF